MSASVALTPPELEGLLVATHFTDALFEAAEHSLRTGNEAGFAIYRAASGLLISEVIHSEDGHTPPGKLPSDSIDLRAVTHESEDIVRPDLVDHLHTHPDGPWTNQLLSRNDLKSHALDDHQVPGLVGMMAMPRASIDVVRLTLTRAQPGKEGQLRCQRINCLNDSVTESDIADAMEHAGMNGAWTGYDLRTRAMRDSAALIVSQLFRVY